MCVLPEFQEGPLQQEGLHNWQVLLTALRRMAQAPDSQPANASFDLVAEMDRNPKLKAAMLGEDRRVVITPCVLPPPRHKVDQWAIGRAMYEKVKKAEAEPVNVLKTITSAAPEKEVGVKVGGIVKSDKGKRTAGLMVKQSKPKLVVDCDAGKQEGVKGSSEHSATRLCHSSSNEEPKTFRRGRKNSKKSDIVDQSFQSPPMKRRKSLDFSPLVQVVTPSGPMSALQVDAPSPTFPQSHSNHSPATSASSILSSTPSKKSVTPPLDMPPPCTPISSVMVGPRMGNPTPGGSQRVARVRPTRRESAPIEKTPRRVLMSSQLKVSRFHFFDKQWVCSL